MAATIPDMDRRDVVGDAVEHHLTFHDGTTRTVYVTDVETPYPDGKLIVSRTDPEGVITMVNRSFVEMSGYAEDELLGAPHHTCGTPSCRARRSRTCGTPSPPAASGTGT